MGGMKHGLDDHQVSLKAPVLAAARVMEANIAVLARDGAAAYAEALRGHDASSDVTRRILGAVAATIDDEDPRGPS